MVVQLSPNWITAVGLTGRLFSLLSNMSVLVRSLEPMHDDLGRDERGISEILGTVLLISMVLLGSATVIIFGASAISDATQRTTTEAATDYLETVDSRLATLSASSAISTRRRRPCSARR